MINASDFCGMSFENFASTASTSFVIPSLIIFFVVSSLVLLILGLIIVQQSRGKFLGIFFLALFINIIILTMIIFLPLSVYNIWEFFKHLLT